MALHSWWQTSLVSSKNNGLHWQWSTHDLHPPQPCRKLDLHAFQLSTPENICVAIDAKQTAPLTHYVCITISSHDGLFKSKALNAVIAPGLCMPIILGLPFLVNHKIICDYAKHECLITIENQKYNLLTQPVQRQFSHDILAAIHDCIKDLTLEQELAHQGANMRKEFAQVFKPIPHVNELPVWPQAHKQLKDPETQIKSHNYPCPHKWKDTWHQLLQQHLDASCIRPSPAPMGSGAFIIPKVDPNAPPCWVNDYWQLNVNTIIDSFPIPQINEILADCACGTYFTTIDMTNSFFQTHMHDDDIEKTMVNTPWGLYEWVVMPMGIKNTPTIHQHHMSAALRPWIGTICHVYINNIAIWLKSIAEHETNVWTILTALRHNKLYCNPKKMKLFSTEIWFLGHQVSAKGI